MSSQLTSNPEHAAHGPSALAWARTIPGGIVSLALLLAGTWFLLTGLLEIINFGFRQPMFDQFKMYPNYLMLPFPDSVLQLENGHRPILPNLVQVAEAQWFSANQNLQLALGGGSVQSRAVAETAPLRSRNGADGQCDSRRQRRRPRRLARSRAGCGDHRRAERH